MKTVMDMDTGDANPPVLMGPRFRDDLTKTVTA